LGYKTTHTLSEYKTWSLLFSQMISLSPLVSVCTPTFNRRPFIPILIQCFRNQIYDKSRIEWIVVDDGTDPVKDVFEQNAQDLLDGGCLKYIRVEHKMNLGAKRNLTHSFCKGDILVYMDDDDYYPPERISHAVETLLKNPQALCAGNTEIYVYYGHIQQMYQCGPYMAMHATAGTFAFRKELLQQTSYEDTAALAEEKYFLKNYTIPLVQLDPLQTILVFSHEHNTFDKKKMLEQIKLQPNSNVVFKPSSLKVSAFIRKWNTFEKEIYRFFMQGMETLLEKYDFGKPHLKPDVMKQMVEMEKNTQLQSNTNAIVMQRPGMESVTLTSQEVVTLLQAQQKEIERLRHLLAEKR